MGLVKMSGVVKGITEPVPFTVPANFADATWAEVIEACERNRVPDTWTVGDQKSMTINGTSYTIDIIGKNHDTYAAGGTAPLTFQMHDCYGTNYAYDSSGNSEWAYCSMRVSSLPAILALMPAEVQAGIKKVNKRTCQESTSTVLLELAEDLFLLSEIELFGKVVFSPASAFPEGSQYAYYAAGNSKVKTCKGTATYWWQRSPTKSYSSQACRVGTGGNAGTSSTTVASGVAFAFCF